MKILFLENRTIWQYGLPSGFRDLGHTVKMSGPITRRRLYSVMSMFRPDLLITVGWGPQHTKESQRLMHECARYFKIPLVYWATEDPNFTEEFSLPLIRRMKPDYVFTISEATARSYRKLDIAASHMDFGFHPSVHRHVTSSREDPYDIVVVANAYPDVLRRYPRHFRKQALKILIRPLLLEGIRVDFFGRDWEKMKSFLGVDIPANWLHGYLSYEKTHRIYSSAKIILGLQNYTDMVTQRTYEILGSSGFLMTCDTPGVRRLLRSGRDVVVSSSPEETVKKVRYYLNRPKERKTIRMNGRRAVESHHYRERARSMLQILEDRQVLKPSNGRRGGHTG